MNIYTLDLNYQNVPQAIASYLIVGPDGPLLIETGPSSTLPTLKAQLALYGYTTNDIKHLCLTHIHLDHAGAAGWWAQQGTQVYVHHRGAPHLIDPSKLIASATRIYGDQMQTLWGDILPAPADKVTPIADGDMIEINGLTFIAHNTPGHANHHHIYQLGNIAFVGDATGLRLPGHTFVDLPAPPPEFHLETWLQTLELIRNFNFETIYPTHFGPSENVPEHLTTFTTLLKEAVGFVKGKMEANIGRDDLVTQYIAWNQARAYQANLSSTMIRQYEAANPLDMSVDGIMRYWRKSGAIATQS